MYRHQTGKCCKIVYVVWDICTNFGLPWLYHYIFIAVAFTNIIGWNMDLSENFPSLISSFSSHLWLVLKSNNAVWSCLVLYRVAHKNRTAYSPQYVDAITGISVWGNFSWEKWNQDQQFWFSSWFSRAHFVRQCRGPKFSLFSLN